MDTLTNHEKAWQKHFFAYLTSQLTSFFGTSLVQFAIVWYITLKTGSGIMVTITMLCSFVPQLLISPFAGVWADRYNRKILIMLSDGMIAFTTLILAVLFLFGVDYYWLVFIVAAMRSLGAGIQSPANNAMLPQLIPQEKMMQLSGVKHSMESVVALISPAVSGALLNYMGLVAIFFVDVITAAIAITVLCFVKARSYKASETEGERSYFGDMKLGIGYIKTHRYLIPLFSFVGLFLFLAVPVAYFSPLMIERLFNGGVWRMTANEILFSCGTLIGGILISTWGGLKNRLVTISISAASFGLLTVAVGVNKSFWWFLVFIALSGIFVPFMTVTSSVLIQENVEEDILGRVFSVYQIVITAVIPLGTLLFGPMCDVIKIEHLCIITGVLMVILGILAYCNKSVRSIAVKKEAAPQVLEQLVET